MLNVKFKAMAGLIKSFLETAGNEKFRSSLYHTLLFRYHVLQDRSITNPGIPPFYSKDFFSKIQKVHQESPLNIFHMSERDWYNLLLEENCTMEVGNSDRWDNREYIKCRVERACPDTDWEQCWRLARLGGLGPDNMSFLFRVIHQTLPTQERVARTKPGAGTICKVQDCSADVTEDIPHALLYCPANRGIGTSLLSCLREIQPGLQADAALRLEIQVEEELELPVIWMMATLLRIVWNLRQSSSKIRLYLVRSQFEAEVNLLRDKRYSVVVPKIEELAENLFP